MIKRCNETAWALSRQLARAILGTWKSVQARKDKNALSHALLFVCLFVALKCKQQRVLNVTKWQQNSLFLFQERGIRAKVEEEIAVVCVWWDWSSAPTALQSQLSLRFAQNPACRKNHQPYRRLALVKLYPCRVRSFFLKRLLKTHVRKNKNNANAIFRCLETLIIYNNYIYIYIYLYSYRYIYTHTYVYINIHL